MNKYNPNEKLEKEQEDALEHYMRRCSELERQVEVLKERIKRLEWSIEEHD